MLNISCGVLLVAATLLLLFIQRRRKPFLYRAFNGHIHSKKRAKFNKPLFSLSIPC